MSFRIFLHHNTPAPEPIEIDPSKTTLNALLDLVSKALKLPNPIETYKFLLSSYLADVINLSEQKENDKESKTLEGLGIKSQSTIVVVSLQVTNKPRRRHKNKKEIEPEIEVSGEEVSLDVDDVIKVLEKTNDKKKRGAILKFAAANAAALLETKGFVNASKETLISFLKDDSLAVEEGKIFEAVLRWAKKNAKKDEASEIKKVLTSDIFNLIRFPLMTTSDIATKVVPTGILEMQQTLDLFSYTGARSALKDKDSKGPSLPKSLEMFSTKQRVPEKKPAKWGQACIPSMISNNGKTATNISYDYHWVLSEERVSKGKKEWKLHIDQMQSNNWMMFGVTHSIPTQNQSYTHSGNYGFTAGQYLLTAGSASSATASSNIVQGNTLICTLDLNLLTFTILVMQTGNTYVVPGLPSGHSWWFHVSLHGSQDRVTLMDS